MAFGADRPTIHCGKSAWCGHQYCDRGRRQRAPDGYTLLLVGVSAAINATLYDNLNFNFIRDITPAAGIMSIPLFMATNPSVPAKTLPEFIARPTTLARELFPK